MNLPAYAEVVLPLPVYQTFTYSIDADIAAHISLGSRVEVQYGKRFLVGVVKEFCSNVKPGIKTKPVIALLDQEPAIPSELLELLCWMSNYYFDPLGELIKLALPNGMLQAERINISLEAAGSAYLAGDILGEHNNIPEKTLRNLHKLLVALPKTGRIEFASLKKKLTKLGRKELRDYEQSGLIKLSYERAGSSLKTKTVQYIKTIDSQKEAIEALAKAPKQKELFLALAKSGFVQRSEFCGGQKNKAHLVGTLIKRGLLIVEHREVSRNPLGRHLLKGEKKSVRHILREDQALAVDAVSTHIKNNEHCCFLLDGSPGSGKTEVYLHAVEQTLKAGRSALLLVPEISLTPQLVSRVAARFGDKVALVHSKLSAGERFDEWRRIRSGEAHVVVGARSAMLAPMQNIGLIVVDEEQDASYKSDDRVFYQAKDMAVLRGKLAGVPVILGSATPSLESVHNTITGQYKKLELKRAKSNKPPKISLIDMGDKNVSRISQLSSELVLAIHEKLAKKEQIILFINRRGWAPYLSCTACKTALSCNQCSVTLAYHRTNGKLVCHSCGSQMAFPSACPECKNEELELIGVGTQRIEDEVELTFPKAKIARMDRDSISSQRQMSKVIDDFSEGETDILIGTQLVTKGHDFPNVTLVGILSADNALNIPDFRSSERTYQQLVQVAGRAGRREKPGLVYIQTFSPTHFVYQCVKNNDSSLFYNQELESRKGLYPPFNRLALIRLKGMSDQATFERSIRLAKRLRMIASQKKHQGMVILGPSQAPIQKIRNKYRYRILLKHQSPSVLHKFISHAKAMNLFVNDKNIRIVIDVDPGSMM